MFRTSYVHLQENHTEHAAFMVCFPCVYASTLPGWRMGRGGGREGGRD